MIRWRNWLVYMLTISACVALMYGIVGAGVGLEAGKSVGGELQEVSGYWQQFKDTYHHNLTHPLAILLLQILCIIVTARAFGFICQKVGLPTVIG